MTIGKMNGTDSNETVPNCFFVKCQFTFGERVIIIFFFTMIFFVSLVGNCVLFSAILRHKRLRRSSTNFSMLSLSFANILITLFCIPVFVIDLFIMGKWVFWSHRLQTCHFCAKRGYKRRSFHPAHHRR